MEVLDTVVRINNSYSYKDYRQLVISSAQLGATTGVEQLPERIEATKINASRMLRIEKQVQIKPELIDIISKLNRPWIWVVIAESWCGDAAQNIPVIAKIAELSSFIELRIVLRDQNLELMDAHLTDGNRSIPKLICYDAQLINEFGTWGSRPQKIQEKANEFKISNPNCKHDELIKSIHFNYAKDGGQAIQEELIILLKKWIEIS